MKSNSQTTFALITTNLTKRCPGLVTLLGEIRNRKSHLTWREVGEALLDVLDDNRTHLNQGDQKIHLNTNNKSDSLTIEVPSNLVDYVRAQLCEGPGARRAYYSHLEKLGISKPSIKIIQTSVSDDDSPTVVVHSAKIDAHQMHFLLHPEPGSIPPAFLTSKIQIETESSGIPNKVKSRKANLAHVFKIDSSTKVNIIEVQPLRETVLKYAKKSISPFIGRKINGLRRIVKNIKGLPSVTDEEDTPEFLSPDDIDFIEGAPRDLSLPAPHPDLVDDTPRRLLARESLAS